MANRLNEGTINPRKQASEAIGVMKKNLKSKNGIILQFILNNSSLFLFFNARANFLL